jgi:hypothetical protein
MKKEVNLVSFPYFKDSLHLQKLNQHIRLHRDFMTHQIAVATGCSFDDAFGILLLLHFCGLGDMKLLVYHQEDSSLPMFVRDFSDGPPVPPFVNPINEQEITNTDDLEYDFLLKLSTKTDLLFVHK